MVSAVLKALNQYITDDCDLNSLSDPDHSGAVFTILYKNGKPYESSASTRCLRGRCGCDDAMQEIKSLQVYVVLASLKSVD